MSANVEFECASVEHECWARVSRLRLWMLVVRLLSQSGESGECEYKCGLLSVALKNGMWFVLFVWLFAFCLFLFVV